MAIIPLWQRLLRTATILVVAAIIGFPFYWLVINALKTPTEVALYPPTWFPSSIRTQNAADAMGVLTVNALINSVIFALSVTVLQLLISMTTGFAIAKMQFPGRRALLLIFIITLFVPFQVLLIPTFLIVRDMNWIDTWQGLVLPVVAQTSFGVFVFRQFYAGISDELLDAARMDGANWGQLFVLIVIPISGPAIAAYVSITILTAWNMYIWPLVATTTIDNRVLPVALSAMITQRAQITPNVAMMGVLITTMPIVVIFVFLQRYFINGLVGGIKE
ncbi:MAG: carbohydrate ABC transporter permease [Pseudomonadota bacterium]|nr:carbohydrate ABC transporter permease [Pseudomonadota bacterium]